MNATLQYGAGAKLDFRLAAGVLVGEFGRCSAAAADTPDKAIAHALDNPLDYPPLSQAAVPGDKVVLALGDEVPRADEIVSALVERIVAAGVDAADISLLRRLPARRAPAAVAVGVVDVGPWQIKELVHDPLDRNRLSYLAASNEGKPIYVNRALAEADLTIPICSLRASASPLHHGVFSDIFPAFSDEKTIQRYRAPIAVESPVQMRRFRREVDEVGWLLGLHYLVAVVPGGPDLAQAVLAGRSTAVAQTGGRLCDELWQFDVPRRADLVVAAVAGGPAQQTWTNLARALLAATRLVDEGGAIALCTELDEPLGPGLQALRGAEHLEVTLRQIAHDRPGDTLVALQLAHAVERGRVYLVSRLNEALVEDLGMAPITDPEQLVRLAARYASCSLLSNAQFALPGVAGEPEASGEAAALETLLEDAREQFE